MTEHDRRQQWTARLPRRLTGKIQVGASLERLVQVEERQPSGQQVGPREDPEQRAPNLLAAGVRQEVLDGPDEAPDRKQESPRVGGVVEPLQLVRQPVELGHGLLAAELRLVRRREHAQGRLERFQSPGGGRDAHQPENLAAAEQVVPPQLEHLRLQQFHGAAGPVQDRRDRGQLARDRPCRRESGSDLRLGSP